MRTTLNSNTLRLETHMNSSAENIHRLNSMRRKIVLILLPISNLTLDHTIAQLEHENTTNAKSNKSTANTGGDC